MMNYISVIYIAVIVLLILLLVGRFGPKGFPGSSRNIAEHFDTYWNHSMGAQSQYAISDNPDQIETSKDLKDTEVLAKYTWNEKDTDGLGVYDKFYEERVHDINYASEQDPTYADRDVLSNTGYIDSKFVIFSPVYGSNMSRYTIKGMGDPDPVYTVFNGQHITLSQKNF